MCGRITQKTGELPGFPSVILTEPLVEPFRPRFNGAPSRLYWVIRRNASTGQFHRDLLLWGFIPNWTKDPGGGRRPINARAEGIVASGMFGKAYARRRCLVPVDSFFEWQAVAGRKWKQPYAIGMKAGEPFALGGIWESWKNPEGGIVRSFAIVTTAANALMLSVHDRMPVIIATKDYDRWLGLEPDPRDLLAPYGDDLMSVWTVGREVGSPANDTAEILAPVPLSETA